MRFKNIIFDCSDTLLHLGGKELMLSLTDGDKARCEDIYSRIFASSAWRDYDCGKMKASELEANLLPLFKQQDQNVVKAYLAQWIDTYTVIPDIPELLKELSQMKVGLYILSDFPPCFETLWSRFDLFKYFDGRVVSYEEGLRKEDPHLFEILLQRYGLQAKDCLFVDDVQKNVDNAVVAGICGCLFTDVQSLKKELEL